jgi:adenosylcobinamide amidohydrolase
VSSNETASADIAIFASDFASVVRRGRHVVVTLREPALVLSTCARNGGMRSDVRFLVNHQSCEGAKHQERADFILGLGQAEYQRHVCAELGLATEETAVMGTAANMQYLGVVTRTWADLSVTAIVTAGVSGNAGCAGDGAHYDEVNGAWVKTSEKAETCELKRGAAETADVAEMRSESGNRAGEFSKEKGMADAKPAGVAHGTINTLLLFSSPLDATALARAVVTMTEAKTSALMELAVGSKYSTRLATGTGTDQFALATPQSGTTLRTWTGQHTKAGELIGDAVRAATREALRWQNGLEASYTRSLFHALGRFGVKEATLKAALVGNFSAAEFELFSANWEAVFHEPQVAAAAYALAAVIDRVQFGTLGASMAHEAVINQAALLAVGLGARAEAFAEVRSELSKDESFLRRSEGREGGAEKLIGAVPEIVAAAIVMGWRLKWRQTDGVALAQRAEDNAPYPGGRG